MHRTLPDRAHASPGWSGLGSDLSRTWQWCRCGFCVWSGGEQGRGVTVNADMSASSLAASLAKGRRKAYPDVDF